MRRRTPTARLSALLAAASATLALATAAPTTVQASPAGGCLGSFTWTLPNTLTNFSLQSTLSWNAICVYLENGVPTPVTVSGHDYYDYTGNCVEGTFGQNDPYGGFGFFVGGIVVYEHTPLGSVNFAEVVLPARPAVTGAEAPCMGKTGETVHWTGSAVVSGLGNGPGPSS